MKKLELVSHLRLLLIIGFIAITAPTLSVTDALAQSSTELETLLKDHVKKRLDLTADEAADFWPAYTDYRREKAAISTNKEYSALERKEKMQTLESTYMEKFKSILPDGKVELLYKAEEEFKQILIKTLEKAN